MAPLHSSLGNKSETPSQKRKKERYSKGQKIMMKLSHKIQCGKGRAQSIVFNPVLIPVWISICLTVEEPIVGSTEEALRLKWG